MFPVAFAAVAVAASGGAATVACSAAALLLLRELVVEWRNAVASWYGAKRKDPDKRISPTLLSSSSPPFSSIKLYSSSIPSKRKKYADVQSMQQIRLFHKLVLI